MRTLLRRLAVFLALVVAADQAIGWALARMFWSPANTELDDISPGIRYAPQVVVSGSSRAKTHYVADSLETYLGKRAFNFGRDGQRSSLYHYAVARMMLAHRAPELWLLEVDEAVFAGDEDPGRLADLLPYADRYPEVREVVEERSATEPLKLWSRIYPYNSMALTLVKSRIRPPGPVARNGYRSLQGELAAPAGGAAPAGFASAAAEHAPAGQVNARKLEYLRRTLRELAGRGVRVVAVRSPVYPESAEAWRAHRREGERLRAMFASLGVRFVDMQAAGDSGFADPGLYKDARHLNERGATRFTRALADSLLRAGPAR
ncbi:MAG TPA: hypothetical protein VFQ76_00950 [Longimicrobiaceae bacterium]|nr:hypothetical protein [Longimicrobiaceae bacterium]